MSDDNRPSSGGKQLPAIRTEIGAGGELIDIENKNRCDAVGLVNTLANPDCVAADASQERLNGPDGPGLPESLHRCAYCDQPGTAADPLQHGRWRPRKPKGDWVHARCRHPWQAGGWRPK